MVFLALASSKFEGGFPRNPARLTAVKYLYTAIHAPSKKIRGGEFFPECSPEAPPAFMKSG